MVGPNIIRDFHYRSEKVFNKDSENKGKDYDRKPFDKAVADGVNYHCVMVWDVDKKGKLTRVPNWSGTTFTVRTKDGHELTYTLRHTDIRDKDELNKMIQTMRKFASDLTLVRTREVINGKTFSITETLGDAKDKSYVCLLKLDGRRGLRPIVTGSRYHRTPLGLGSARIDNKQGFYGLDLGRLMPGQNGWLKAGAYYVVNGYSRGSAGKYINMANPYLHEALQFKTAGFLLEEMNKVAGDVKDYAKKYGKGDELWQGVNTLQVKNPKRATRVPTHVKLNEDLKANLVERNYTLQAKRGKLRRDRLWGTEVSETLKGEIKGLQEDVYGLHQAILAKAMNNEDQLEAVNVMGMFWEIRNETRAAIAAERLRPLDEQDTGELDRHEQRVQRAIDQIQEIMSLRVVLILQPELENGHLEALSKVQTALSKMEIDDPQAMDKMMNDIDRLIDRAKAILFDLNDEVEAAFETGDHINLLAKQHKCSIEMLTDTQEL